MPLNGRIFFTLIMLAIFVAMVLTAFGFPPLARFVPLVIGIPGIALTLGQLIVDIRTARETAAARGAHWAFETDQPAAPAREDERDGSVVKRELVLFVYFFGLVAGILLFGFWLTIPVFIVVFLRLHQHESWRFTLSLAAVGTAVLYLVFDRMLSIILHQGFITTAVLERFAGY